MARRRRSGQITRAAANLYRRHVPAFVVIGLLAIPVSVVALLDVVVLQHLPYLGTVVRVSTEQAPPGNRLLLGSWVATSFWPVT